MARSKLAHFLNRPETNMGHQWTLRLALGPPMLSREERNPLSQWWWTVDRPLLGAILAAAIRAEAARRGLAEGRSEAIVVAQTAVEEELVGDRA